MYAILDDAARRARAYLDNLDRRPVAPSAAATSALSQLDEPLPQQPSDPAQTLALLDRLVSPATMAMAGPRFFGFVIGGTFPVTLAANRRAADYGDHRRRSASHAAQIPRYVGIGPWANRARAGGRARPHARRGAAANYRTQHRLSAGRQRKHGCL